MTPKKSIVDPISRRNFLAISAAVPAVVVAQSLGSGASTASAQSTTLSTDSMAQPATDAKKYSVGLELYSVRTELSHDLPKTLTAVSKMGYEAVEFYAPYASWSFPQAKDIKSLMDDLGLRCYSTHNNGVATFTPGDAMAKAIELNQILGSRLLVLASAPSAKGVDSWKELCGKLTTAADLLKAHGLTAGFHNHQTEWAPLDGTMRTMDVIAANTPPEFVLQLDVGTCVAAGADPVAWIKANPGRIKTIHLKDWAPGDNAQEKGYRVLFGEGVCPWKEIIAAEESVGGVEHYLIEQEGSRYPELESVQRCLENWKKLRAA
ncbi:MAG TPA: sugar phosphate isomerase/epimerase family protein [Verrucomicrobiae bacterium]|jgi:sugar phosphate isomerase/epimerase|nr:sugar phosphate isomerase/epimerase family protein [Verrucomicrobiae bacterium]